MYYELSKKEVLEKLNSSEKGLTIKEANERLKKYGGKISKTRKKLFKEGKLPMPKGAFKKGQRKGIAPWNKGKKISDITKEKIRLANKGKRFTKEHKKKRKKN